jgi:hypothetical protein
MVYTFFNMDGYLTGAQIACGVDRLLDAFIVPTAVKGDGKIAGSRRGLREKGITE